MGTCAPKADMATFVGQCMLGARGPGPHLRGPSIANQVYRLQGAFVKRLYTMQVQHRLWQLGVYVHECGGNLHVCHSCGNSLPMHRPSIELGFSSNIVRIH